MMGIQTVDKILAKYPTKIKIYPHIQCHKRSLSSPGPQVVVSLLLLLLLCQLVAPAPSIGNNQPPISVLNIKYEVQFSFCNNLWQHCRSSGKIYQKFFASRRVGVKMVDAGPQQNGSLVGNAQATSPEPYYHGVFLRLFPDHFVGSLLKYELALAWIGHGKCCLPTFQLNPF